MKVAVIGAGAVTIAYGETLPGSLEDLTASDAYRFTAAAGDRRGKGRRGRGHVRLQARRGLSRGTHR